MKKAKQIISLLLLVVLFAAFNAGIYMIGTKRCLSNFGTAAQAKMIDVEKYLPHKENFLAVKIDSSLELTDNLPVLDGATALLPVYSAFANAVYPEGSCRFENNAFSLDSAMQYRNTVGAYKAVADGDADIIFCAGPSKGQREYAEKKGAELVMVPIGYEAFVFIVNSKNPVDNLTQEQIRSIYTGECSNWKKVGGANRLINPLTRPEGSGSQTAMLSFMGGREIKKPPFAAIGASIGYSFRWYVEGIVDNGDVKMLSVDGVYPSAENIRNGSYPIVSNFYAVYRADNENPNIKPLIEWILSEEGQHIVNESGYIGVK